MDDIAVTAGVSKQTVYKHFGDKERLFIEMVVGTIHRFGQPFFAKVVESRDADAVEAQLLSLAAKLAQTVTQPHVLRLRRLVVAEVVRFPRLGREYFEQGPGQGIEALADLFSTYDRLGLLHIEDPRRAASHFTWLVIAEPVSRVMLLGEDAAHTPEELDQHLDEAVQIFLAAYGPDSA